MTLDTPSTSEKLSALVHVLNQLTNRGAQFVMYASSLGAIALVAKSDMPLEFLSAGIGVNLMSSIIEKVARNKNGISRSEIEIAVEEAILVSNLDKLLTEDKHLRTMARLMRQQNKIFFATKSNEFELRRLSALVETLVQSSSESSSQNALNNITHFYSLSERSDFVEDTHSKVRDLWQRAELLEKSFTIGSSVSLYRDAVVHVSAAIKKTDLLSSRELVQLQILLSKAEERYNDIRQRHEIPLSRQEGEVVDLILNFSKLFDHNPETLVTFFSGEGFNDDPKVMSVEQALHIAQARLVRFWERKTSEYLDSTRSYLNKHQPREAITMLNRCEELSGRYDERMGIRFPHYLEHRIKTMATEIEAELNLLKSAERKVQMARLEPDLHKARNFLDEAKKDYPFLAELQQLSQDLYANSSSQ